MSRRRTGGVAVAMEAGRRGDLCLRPLGARLPAALVCGRVSDGGTLVARSCVAWEPGAWDEVFVVLRVDAGCQAACWQGRPVVGKH